LNEKEGRNETNALWFSNPFGKKEEEGATCTIKGDKSSPNLHNFSIYPIHLSKAMPSQIHLLLMMQILLLRVN
jgi:hypothetical protein